MPIDPKEPALVFTSVGGTATFRQLKKVDWTPQPDITAHELAKLMPLLISMGMRPLNYWEDFIPEEAKRHFTIADK